MPSHLKSKSATKSKNKRRKRTKSNIEHSSDASEGDLELDKEIYPVGHYLSDRSEMIEQMFSILRKDKIQSMLPPVLKDINWHDLKTYCLDQLNSMSEKQIITILEGKPYDLSLEDESGKAQLENDDTCSSSSSSSLTSSGTNESSTGSSEGSECEPETSANVTTSDGVTIKPDPDKIEDDPDMLQIGFSPKEMGDLFDEEEDIDKKQKDYVDKGENKNTDEPLSGKKDEATEGKTLLEILELEMRARAIRALLKQSSSVTENLDKENPSCTGKSTRSKEDVSPSNISVDSKSPPKRPLHSSSSVKVNIKEEILSDEDDVVFVSESPVVDSPIRKKQKKAGKECLSAIYNVSADILKFQPTVMSSTSKLCVVDTSGKPIILPKSKSHVNSKIDSKAVIVIDNDSHDENESAKLLLNETSSNRTIKKEEAASPSKILKPQVRLKSLDSLLDSKTSSEAVVKLPD